MITNSTLTSSVVWNRDLASVALRAATELDSIIQKRPSSVDGIRAFAEQLATRVVRAGESGPASLVDPTTTVVLSRAAGEAGRKPPRQVEEVAVLAGRVVAEMGSVTQGGDENAVKTSLESLRSFCLAVSRHAASMAPLPLEGPEHPFRR